ncbi:MAG: tetratricopeptide repeat protein [Bacteroidia bacterium]|nr:tetratricopeptide repeat protein [Bacteroidia bacterium]
MKPALLILLTLLLIPAAFAQPTVSTSGNNSPAVIARNFSVTYGVRADAIEAILWIYEAEGYDAGRRNRATEQIIREYAQSPERQQQADVLSEATRSSINNPQIASALEWDLFARSHYLSTTSYNSPAVVAQGDVNIWYGIPPKALRALAAQLEKNKVDFDKLETQLAELARKYEEVSNTLVNREDEMAKEAKLLLDEGEIDEAVKVLGDRRYALKKQRERAEKREAEAAFDYAQGLSLQLKYDSAAIEYKAAVDLDPENSSYHLYYANNENTLARYDQAIRHYEIALGIDSVKRDNQERIATLLNNLGFAWYSKGEYDKAIGYYDKALQISLKALGENHPDVATRYDNLGSAWRAKGEYDKAIGYYDKALQISLKALGENHPDVAASYNNLGGVWRAKWEYDKAIGYFDKALQIFLKALGENHPDVATGYNNLGGVWDSKGEYDKAIGYFDKALQINVKAFGENHPDVATGYYNLGSAWYSKGEYDKAIDYYEKCQAILDLFFESTHPYQKTTTQSLSRATNSRGMELYSEKNYQAALGYFQKAFKNAQRAEDDAFSLTCLNNIGSMYKNLQQYEAGLQNLEAGLQLAAQINQTLDQQIKEQVTPEMLANPEVQAKIAELKNLALIRRMKYHKVGCLIGLKRSKEAKALARQLWREGLETNDTRLLEDLKRDGYDVGE